MDFQSYSFEKQEIVRRITADAEPFNDIQEASLDGFIKRCSHSRVVLLGEASHGTKEFYSMRSRLTLELIKRLQFNVVAIEWDWPDIAVTNRYIHHLQTEEKANFRRFSAWMWNNLEFMELIEHLRHHNAFIIQPSKTVNLYGLDLYCIEQSIDAILEYLERQHPTLASKARHHYRNLAAWSARPGDYAQAVTNHECESCERDVAEILKAVVARSSEFARGEEFFHLIRNMNLIVHAENCYRHILGSSATHWNIRDRYMFETLEALLDFHGQNSKVIVWAHNSHVGNGSATPMRDIDVTNLGQLCKKRFKTACYSVGFGFDHGQIIAATDYGAPAQIFNIPPAHLDSYDHLFHETHLSSFFLPLRLEHQRHYSRDALLEKRTTRGFGSVCKIDGSDYHVPTCLPEQFDEYIWFDESHPLSIL